MVGWSVSHLFPPYNAPDPPNSGGGREINVPGASNVGHRLILASKADEFDTSVVMDDRAVLGAHSQGLSAYSCSSVSLDINLFKKKLTSKRVYDRVNAIVFRKKK